MDRFYKSTDNDVDYFKEASSAKNTKKSTNNWIKAYETWAGARGFYTKSEKYKPEDLNQTLEKFYIEIRRKDCKDYEPDSLKVMLAALDRYLKSRDYPVSIIKGQEFNSSRKVIERRARKLREEGKGKQPHKSSSITDAEEAVLWEEKKFGDSSARSLQNTVWRTIVQHFGLRGRDNHYNLKIERTFESR